MRKSVGQRQFDIVDQMLSMHAMLRDKFRKKHLYLNLSLLLVSVFLCAVVFVDRSIFSSFGLEAKTINFSMGIASVLCFAFSLIEYRVDWQGKAAMHTDAVKKLSSLKADYRDIYTTELEETHKESNHLSKEYQNVMDNIVEIPEGFFLELKAKHLRKVLLSKKISVAPGAPIILLKMQLLFGSIFDSFIGKSKK